QNPAQAEGDACHQHCIAHGRAGDGQQGRAAAAACAGRDHQRDNRTRRQEQDERDDEKGGEKVPVHRLSSPGRCRRALTYSPSSSLSRSTETTCSSSAVLSTITPCVERPARRMPETGVRISLPWSVTIMI